MLRGRGNTGQNIVCPLHRWTYDLKGELIGAPHFADDPCLSLPTTRCRPGTAWSSRRRGRPAGREVATDLAGLGPVADLDFTGYAFDSVKLHECNYNWKTFIEVYLEDYHVAPFHPGSASSSPARPALGVRAAPFGADGRAEERARQARLGRLPQVARRGARLSPGALRRPGAQHGAIWLTYYPATMVEWYPHVLVVSTLDPKGPDKTLNVVEFFYPEEIHAFEREFVEAEQAAYWETCAEDDEIALRMDAGRRALYERGDDDAGPYQSPMEDGMQQFHEWYRKRMG
jgi:phenylpropionate dioxygenase-like ring-hydroxylating dioxygenase large terminal subunit